MSYLQPYIIGSAILGVVLILAAALGQWQRWPEPDDWRSKYGRVAVRRK